MLQRRRVLQAVNVTSKEKTQEVKPSLAILQYAECP